MVALRSEVLRKPLGLTYTPEQLAAEHQAIHFVCFAHDRAIGCLFLTRLSEDTLQLRQMAVADDMQGRGIGRLLVQHAEECARAWRYKEIRLHAREAAIGFYLACGFVEYGERFFEVGLPHRHMRKLLRAFPPSSPHSCNH